LSNAGVSPRRPWETGRERRGYRCKNCGATEDDFYLPFGYLQIRVRDPQATPDQSTYAIAAVVCSPSCLVTLAQQWDRRLAASRPRG
jgi:hypothetical protein